jgi:DNA repair photolyase
MRDTWYHNDIAPFETKKSKSIIHPFKVKQHDGLTINPYQGCQHRCGYCYATYEWSPDFYDKIYVKSNAAEVLDSQLRSWKYDTIEPVMISSATDPYQPAEVRYNITRGCIEILQKYDVPYYVFTKSSIILRDLELHQKYKNNCSLVWSITTCNEKIRRVIEPGTPPSSSIFSVIRKFSEAGVCCGVNIDPILPLITDTEEEIDMILDECKRSNVKYVFGAFLRLRSDIWQRMKIILKLLELDIGIAEYMNKIYQFTEPLMPEYNLSVNENYSQGLLAKLEEKIVKKGILYDFPEFIGSRRIKRNTRNPSNLGGGQLTIMEFT